MSSSAEILVKLLRIAFGDEPASSLPSVIDWREVIELSCQQGVAAIAIDGLQEIYAAVPYLELELDGPELEDLKYKWIGASLNAEQDYEKIWHFAKQVANLWNTNGIKTFVLKGLSIGQHYPIPSHRTCSDLDVYLIKSQEYIEGCGTCAYELGNMFAKGNGASVDTSYYKHSKILYYGLTIENHQHILPVKGSKRTKELERWLLRHLGDGDSIENTSLLCPSQLFNAVYVLSHAQEHFLNEGITFRHVIDWGVVISHCQSVDWNEWRNVCSRYGLLDFGYAMSRLAEMLTGIKAPFTCKVNVVAEQRLLKDILTKRKQKKHGFARRFQLICNMFRSSWKFRLFSNQSFVRFAAGRIWGYFYDKDIQ